MSGTDQAEQAFHFHLEEFKQLRAEILQRQKIQFSTEIGSATAVFVLVSYLIGNEQAVSSRGAQWAWWLPVVIVLVGFILSRGFANRAFVIGEYIRDKAEAAYARDGKGWEALLAPPGARRSKLSLSKGVFWLFLLGLSMAVALKMARPAILLQLW